MVNDHTPVSRPKNLEILTDNSPKANRDLMNNDGAKFDASCFSSLNNSGLSRLSTQFQSAQSFSVFSSFSNIDNLSSNDNFGQPLPHNLLQNNLQNRSLWESKSAHNQNSTSSMFEEMFGRQKALPFSDVAENQVKKSSVGEIGSGLTNGHIDNKSDNPFEAQSQSNSKNIWHHHDFFSTNQNGHNNDFVSLDKSASNSTTKSRSNLPSTMLPWPSSISSDPITFSPETWGPPAESNNSETGLDEKNKMDVDGFEYVKKLFDSNENHDNLTSWLEKNYKSRGSSVSKILVFFEKYIKMMLSRDVKLCYGNFNEFSAMLQEDLKKFEASTFTLEELQLFQKIYTIFNDSFEIFKQEQSGLSDHFDVFSLAIKNIAFSTANGSTIAQEDVMKVENKITNMLSEMYTEKYNINFLNLVRFYRGIIYSVPNEILNNLPLISEQSKLVNTKSGNPTDPLFVAYRNLIDELDKYNKKPQADNFLHHQHLKTSAQEDSALNDDTGTDFRNETPISESKDMNNNKDNEQLNYFQEMIESEMDLSSWTMSRQSSFSSNVPPVFSHINNLKVEPSVYMPHYYPVKHNMLNFQGPIVAFATKIRPKNNGAYYMSPNRHTLEIIVDTELTKSLTGPVVFENSEYLMANKSFNKLVARVKKHFPNLPIKQLVELVIQSKYAIMKKGHTQYGFSGFKIKDLVRFIVEHICDNANPNMNISYDSTKDKKGVSWSKVASISSHSNAPVMSPSLSSAKDNSSVASNSSFSSRDSPQNCALCKNPVSDHSVSDENKKLALISCNHVFHNECIEIVTKAKAQPTCPLCDQFSLRHEEFPSL